MRLPVLLAVFFILLPTIAWAQFDPSSFSDTPQIGITLNPAHPSPGEIVTASLDDYAGGVYGSKIDWSYAGELIAAAANQRQVRFVAGEAGSNAAIEARLILPQGGVQTLREVVEPIYMDIVIEPQTRVPDWYTGRSLPSLGSQINATVLLNDGSFIDPNTVVYTWRVNQKVLEGGPVRGGSKMAFVTPRGGSVVLSVTATDLQGETIASRSVNINIALPELTFYEKHALYGMQSTPLNRNSSIVGSILTIQAEPFFLDSRVYNDPDVAKWEIDRVPTNNGSANPYEITLRRSGNNGSTNVNFHVRSLQEILQGSEESIFINF